MPLISLISVSESSNFLDEGKDDEVYWGSSQSGRDAYLPTFFCTRPTFVSVCFFRLLMLPFVSLMLLSVSFNAHLQS